MRLANLFYKPGPSLYYPVVLEQRVVILKSLGQGVMKGRSSYSPDGY
jgi:hypothetical protein